MRRSALALAGILFTTILSPIPASAAATTYVSAFGNDSADCLTPFTPCATFAKAITVTNAKGVIRVMAPGFYGPVLIDKSLSIIAEDVNGGIYNGSVGSGATGMGAIVVNAGASDVVTLRGIMIDQAGTAKQGITFTKGAALHIKNCLIRGSTLNGAAGIRVTTGNAELHVSDCTVSEFWHGIMLKPVAGTLHAVINRMSIEKTTSDGIQAMASGGSVFGTVRDSTISGAGGVGIIAKQVGDSGNAALLVERTSSSGNANGIRAQGGNAIVRIGETLVTRNGTGLATSNGGEILSYQTSKVFGNFIEGSPSGTLVHK
jgi:hypothetical protein